MWSENEFSQIKMSTAKFWTLLYVQKREIQNKHMHRWMISIFQYNPMWVFGFSFVQEQFSTHRIVPRYLYYIYDADKKWQFRDSTQALVNESQNCKLTDETTLLKDQVNCPKCHFVLLLKVEPEITPYKIVREGTKEKETK